MHAVHAHANLKATTQQEAWDISRVHEIGPALRHHLLPHLPLKVFVNLSHTSRDWHLLLIESTPLSQLSPQAKQELLPSGLTSQLSIHKAMELQGQLLGRLRSTGASAVTVLDPVQLQMVKPSSSEATSAQSDSHTMQPITDL